MITMPKGDKVQSLHRKSVSTASAAGSNARSSSWSTKDDEVLIQARTQGLNWNQIAPKHFPSKSPNACRKRHERLMERQNAEQWDGVKLDVLAQAYMDCRREMWSILAARVGEKWTTIEQKCMEKGLKNLNQAYRSSQKKQGTYEDQNEDSGIGFLTDEESDDRIHLPEVPEASAYTPTEQPRVPSIESMLSYPAHSLQPQTLPSQMLQPQTLQQPPFHPQSHQRSYPFSSQPE